MCHAARATFVILTGSIAGLLGFLISEIERNRFIQYLQNRTEARRSKQSLSLHTA